MPVIAGFDKLASVPEEQITEKIGRPPRHIRQTGHDGLLENEGGRARRCSPHEQFVWVISGAIRLRIGAEARTIKPGDIAVIPGGSCTKRPRSAPWRWLRGFRCVGARSRSVRPLGAAPYPRRLQTGTRAGFGRRRRPARAPSPSSGFRPTANASARSWIASRGSQHCRVGATGAVEALAC